MGISFDRLLNIIYELRLFVVFPLYMIWLALAVYLLARRNKAFFVCLVAFPLVIFSIDIAATYSGWLYRMVLRKIYATAPDHSIDIGRMPPNIRAEYAKHDYHPRLRDIKAKLLGATVLFPIIIVIGSAIWVVVSKHCPIAHSRGTAEG